MSTLEKAVSQKHLTPDTVDMQFCSDWLKDEIKTLFAQRDALIRSDARFVDGKVKNLEERVKELEDEVVCEHQAAVDMFCKYDELRDALEKIADPRKRDHQEPDAYTQLGCIMNIANEALEKANKSEK
jgi:hypothetical protein